MSTQSSLQQKKKKGGNEPWRNKERHYCPLCNAWMGSDRQSILLHENGKKHREAAESDLKRRREDKTRREKDRSDLDKVFAKVNAVAAGSSNSISSISGGGSYNNNFGVRKPWEQPIIQQQPQHHKIQGGTQHAKPEKSSSSSNVVSVQPVKQTPPLGSSSSSAAAAAATETTPDVNAGHYNIEGTSYLDGSIFATILEEDMPIQLWMGDPNASDAEKRDLRSLNNWKMALLAKVVRKRNNPGGTTSSNVVDTAATTTNTLCHVSYLQNSNDDDETLETNVPPARIRLVLGSDPLIPSTLEEAHLALLGGEQIIQVAEGSNDGAAQEQQQQQIDENTGLSTWSTTAVRKVSSHYEQNQERKRKREHEKELAEYKEKKEKELKARMMEEAKYANAHDSALGAYDVWSSSAASAVEGKTAAYKGVDINKETKVEVLDTAKSLSKGMGNVAFKKKKVKKKSIRRTSADDDN